MLEQLQQALRDADERDMVHEAVYVVKATLPALIACVEALALTKASFEDLLNGYPERELHEPYQVTLNRAEFTLAKLQGDSK